MVCSTFSRLKSNLCRFIRFGHNPTARWDGGGHFRAMVWYCTGLYKEFPVSNRHHLHCCRFHRYFRLVEVMWYAIVANGTGWECCVLKLLPWKWVWDAESVEHVVRIARAGLWKEKYMSSSRQWCAMWQPKLQRCDRQAVGVSPLQS